MKSIKVNTTRELRRGIVFHYAPFMLHCLFPEVINELYNYDTVYRQKTPDQSIGNFSSIYENLMGNKNVEVSKQNFDTLNINIINCEFKKEYCTKEYFDKFRNYIFTKYDIDGSTYDSNYPEVLLIKRSKVNLIDDAELKRQLNPHQLANGPDRREIQNINQVESFLKQKYGERFKAVSLEHIPHKEQVKHFNNAKYIICSHGGGMANMFFCKENTKVVEIDIFRENRFKLFDWISDVLSLNHIKCNNSYSDIIASLNKNAIE